MEMYEVDVFLYMATTNQVTVTPAISHKDALCKVLHLLPMEVEIVSGIDTGLIMYQTVKGPCFVKLLKRKSVRLEVTATCPYVCFYEIYTTRAKTQDGLLKAHDRAIKLAQKEMQRRGILWTNITCKTLAN